MGGKFREFLEILVRTFGLMALPAFSFKRLALREIAKFSRTQLVSQAAALLEGGGPGAVPNLGGPVFERSCWTSRHASLKWDFILESDRHSIHVLNAVSPAFSCSLPFSRYVGERIGTLLN
jgi:hypothetical protein